MNKSKNTGLEIKLVVNTKAVKVDDPIMVEVLFANKGPLPVIVNSRFSMGYPDTSDRDLYFEIHRENGKKYMGYKNFQVDYRSKDLVPEHFKTLRPGEVMRATYDLQEWYRITEPGAYTVRAVYDPDQNLDINNAVKGPLPSAAITIRVGS